MSSWLCAEFGSPEQLCAAAAEVRAAGIRRVEACAPYEVEGLAQALQLPPSKLPLIALVGGVTGGAIGYAVQWYVNAWSYPLDAGGRPANAVPSFIFVTFESLVLSAALAVFVGLFILLGLPRYWHAAWTVDGFERVTIDRFWLLIDTGDASFARVPCRRLLEALAPIQIVETGDAS